jgi:hypothetical protein
MAHFQLAFKYDTIAREIPALLDGIDEPEKTSAQFE